jgi:hypothetical protein
MKNKKTVLLLVLFIALFAFSTTACGGGKSINIAKKLKEYLDKQPANGPDKPIKVAMKANEMMIKDIMRVITEAGKYVSLDLSGSPLTVIPSETFAWCTSLASVIIPNSVTSIGWNAFYECTRLTSITIPSSVTSIGDRAFAGCSSLTSITIPNSVISIEQRAFAFCYNLTSITIPNNVTDIAFQTFGGCASLTRVTIPDSVTKIDAFAFAFCTSLTSVTIPSSVTSIGGRAFAECTSLASVTFQGKSELERSREGDGPFPGDLHEKYLAGGIGTYTRPSGGSTWTKQ